MPSLVLEAFDSEVAQRLAAAASEDSFALHGEPPQEIFLVAYDGAEAIGCGGFKRLEADVVELKRMVRPARVARAGRELRDLRCARAGGARHRCGPSAAGDRVNNAAAIGLYRSAGYEPIPCWGRFAADPKSLCLEKRC